MATGAAVKVTLWTPKEGIGDLGDREDVAEFREALAADYLAVVQARPAPLGGGALHSLFIEVISTISFSTAAKLLVEGAAFDAIKHGAKTLLLKPLLAAYEKLRKRHRDGDVDIDDFRIVFQDALIRILSISSGSVVGQLEMILRAVARNYDAMRLQDGEAPMAITIPVFEDIASDRVCRFRIIGDIEEPIASTGNSDYFAFWGVEYGDGRLRVFDVERQLLLDEEWFTLERYWTEIEKKGTAVQ